MSGVELRRVLRRRLAIALAGEGWLPAEPQPVSARAIARFVQPCGHGIAATADIVDGDVFDRVPVTIPVERIGVSYEPLRRLWPMLGERYSLSVLRQIGHPFDRVTGGGGIVISSEDDIDAAVRELIPWLIRNGPVKASRYPDVDALLSEVRRGSGVAQPEVALLAAAGRFDEARVALNRYRPVTGSQKGDRAARQFVHQMRRYLDAEVDPAIVAPPPPPREHRNIDHPKWLEVRHATETRRAALAAVRALPADLDRADLRAALERELTARGETESPLFIETALDSLRTPRSEKPSKLIQGTLSATRLAIKGVRKLRDGTLLNDIPDTSPPAWLELPDRAAYPVTEHKSAEWAAVTLGQETIDVIARAYEETPRVFGPTAQLQAWIEHSTAEPDRVTVGLGEKGVGVLEPGAAEAYQRTLREASHRDELPFTRARLTALADNRYLLEVQLPFA